MVIQQIDFTFVFLVKAQSKIGVVLVAQECADLFVPKRNKFSTVNVKSQSLNFNANNFVHKSMNY